jgi:hypothetical protein
MPKMFQQSADTQRLVDVFVNMLMSEKISFPNLSLKVGFRVHSSLPAYHSAKRIAERDHGVFISTVRKFGVFRGTGEDMADSLEDISSRIRKMAKKSITRADLAIENNLPDDKYVRTVERRNRASIIYSTSAAPMPQSNRRRPEPASEAAKINPYSALRTIK